MSVRDNAFIELTRAESLLSNWKYLPGMQIKLFTNHLIKALDAVACYVLDEETAVEQSYLTLSRVRLFSDASIENSFYETYYYLKNLLRRDIQRVNPDKVKIISDKNIVIADRDYFQFFVNNVKQVLDEAFQ